jgi:uncharacterized membrane protein YeaQ/YmgE (transglycosylase-associated protein family)
VTPPPAAVETIERDHRCRPRLGREQACRFSSTVRNVTVVIVLIAVVLVLLLAGAVVGLAFNLLWLALTGLIVGALGRLVLPGRQQVSLLATALVGIGASLLGGILANAFDVGWLLRFPIAVALAAIGIAVFASSERGTSRSR